MAYIQELRALVGTRPLILVGAMVMILNDRQQVLLQHRTDDHTWGFPGGFMEPGERIEETARREVLEETGLEVGEMRLFKVLSGKDHFYEYPNGDQVYAVALVYVTRDARGEARVDGVEGSEVGFFPLDALPEGIFPNDRVLVQDFLARGGLEAHGPS